MEENKKSSKKVVIGLAVLVALIVVFAGCFFLFKPGTEKGAKTITIQVVNKAAETKTYETHTDAEYLKQAMEETKGLTFSGPESDYGLFVDTINGEKADYNVDGSYWAVYVNGEYGNYGVDQQPVADKDVFRFEYTVYTAAE